MDKQTVLGIIDKLLIVQERDGRISRCQKELNDIPNLKKGVETKLNQNKAAVDNAKEAIKTRLVAVKQCDVEIETIRQQVSKLRDQQFQIKSNEEFKVLNKEIDGLQAKIKRLEDNEIELMEKAEQAQQEEINLKAELSKAEGMIRVETQQLDERYRNLEAEVQQLLSERQGLVVGIPEDWLNRYNRILENRKDMALVAADNNGCGGCHMKLPPHVIQDVKRAEAIVICSFCGRLLYWAA